MKRALALLLVFTSLTYPSLTQANITGLTYRDDGDGYLVCQSTNLFFSGHEGTLSMVGDLYNAPGHMLGTVTSDTEADPTLRLSSALNNDTGFTWSSLIVNTYLDRPFTYVGGSFGSGTPGDWTFSAATIVPNTNPDFFGGTGYMGTFTISGGTPINSVAPGNELDFTYQVNFSGSLSYRIAQELIAVPEPGSMALLAAGGLVLGAAVRRSRKSGC